MAATSRSTARRRGGRAHRDEVLPAGVTVLLAGPAIGMGGQVVLTQIVAVDATMWAAAIVWTLGLAVLGAVMPSPTLAGVAGGVGGALAAVSHHLAARWFDGIPIDVLLLEAGAVVAAVVGPLLGLGGFWLTHRRDRSRPLVVSLVSGAVLIAALAVADAMIDG